MKIEEAQKLYSEMKSCSACAMRQGCTQVVTYDGFLDDTPLLLIVGETPRKEEDERGTPFVGDCGILLREALRATKILKKNNTVMTNMVKCRPPGDKFPSDKNIPRLCISKWLDKEITAIEPKRMLLLGSMPLLFVAGLKGISKARGNWLTVKGVRTMATFHPSYVIRQMSEGDLETRQSFFDDIKMVAEEIAQLQEVLT
jgi:uracil-DNA glycosylase family 4